MVLTLYNSKTQTKQLFTPINPELIKLYVCGPTVYDHPHIGNARSNVIYDILYRLLCFEYKQVCYVRNITDVDDKIIDRAKDLAITIEALTTQTTKNFHSDMAYINCLTPTHEPKATEHIDEMIEIIQLLLDKGYAYESDKHVYFEVSKAKDYNILSNRLSEGALEGEHVRHTESKKAAADFVLWKPDDDLTSSFSSPYGRGRPGWHIECSAMSHRYLGENFDIHGGGADLIFPHHTNEIAQSTHAYPNSNFANYWVHNGFLTVNGDKMSKSLGNFITVRDLINQNIQGEVIRLALLSSHYRKPLDYSDKSLTNAKAQLNYWYRAIELINHNDDLANNSKVTSEVLEALNNDLNVPLVIKLINDYAKRLHNDINDDRARQALIGSANFMGFLQQTSQQWFLGNEDSSWIDEMIKKRAQAKINRDFALADQLRQELLNHNIILEDDLSGNTKWRKR